MVLPVISRLTSWVQGGWQQLQTKVLRWTQPAKVSLTIGTIADLPRSRTQLMLENILLRQQLIVLQQQVYCFQTATHGGRLNSSWQEKEASVEGKAELALD